MEKVDYAFRDEKVNIFAMTFGGLFNKYPYQIMLCKKDLLQRKGPYVLDPKRSNSRYDLSEKGILYFNKMKNIHYDLRYIAYVDAEIKVKITLDLFKELSKEGFFSIWTPESPYKYFEGAKEGYLVLFRVYKSNNTLDETLLEKGRKGRNFYFGLDNTTFSEIVSPVISNEEYYFMKDQLYTLIQNQGWLLQINNYSNNSLRIPNIPYEYIVKEEEKAIKANSSLSLDELIKKISGKKIENKSVIVETKQYYRDPDICSFALKRAQGRCECCGEEAPFKRYDGRPYLETHHLTPLSVGGSDSMYNVCGVCANCHRELHFGVNREILKKKILKNINKV